MWTGGVLVLLQIDREWCVCVCVRIVFVAAGERWMEMEMEMMLTAALSRLSLGADNRPPTQFTEALGNAEVRPETQSPRFKGQ